METGPCLVTERSLTSVKNLNFNISIRNGACLVRKKATEDPKRNGAWSDHGTGPGLVMERSPVQSRSGA